MGIITKAVSQNEKLLSLYGGMVLFVWLERVNNLVWGVPTLVLILSAGIYLSVRTGFIQIRLFPRAFRKFMCQIRNGEESSKGTSGYRALCTALAATVGTGNLAGVAGAIALGGPGAIFWMWICALLGMVTKFSEAALSVRFRVKNSKQENIGGPMYMIENGLGKKWKWLAMLYCFFGVVASFGVGNATQINTVLGALNSSIIYFGGTESFTGNLLLGLILAVLITALFLGGAKRIGAFAEKMVPLASLGYILLCTYVLIVRANMIPEALRAIVAGAFSPNAVSGGTLGSAFVALQIGASRGVFTNEAGMGTAGIAHASAEVQHPVDQGLMGIMEVFIDTIVICTMTALVILCSGVEIPYGMDTGIQLTANAFSVVCGRWISIPITVALCCFAIGTILGWGLYGMRCAQYLFDEKAWKKFVFAQAIMVVFGAVMRAQTVWLLAVIVNGLMAIPNLIALLLLSPELFKLIDNYKIRTRWSESGPDTNHTAVNLMVPPSLSTDT